MLDWDVSEQPGQFVQNAAHLMKRMFFSNPNSSDISQYWHLYVPTMPLETFIQRCFKYTPHPISCFSMTFCLLKRVPQALRFPSHAYIMFSLCLLLSIKFLCDEHHDNRYYGTLFGLSLHEINSLETKICKLLDWDIYIPDIKIKEAFHKLRTSELLYLANATEVCDTLP